MYLSLDPERIVDTGQKLQQRIAERFPHSGLSLVAAELLSVSGKAAAVSAWLARPHLPIRLLAGAGIAAIVLVIIGAVWSVKVSPEVNSLAELLQGLEAGINEVVFLCLAIFFLVTMESRLKRRRALKSIHILRSLAHIIDMHQLTKDPESVTGRLPGTASSPQRSLTPQELIRYLDYCSELLSLISKVAALYVQCFDDPVTLSAVNDVEGLTNGLSRKIWQKISILERRLPSPEAPRGGPLPPAPPPG